MPRLALFSDLHREFYYDYGWFFQRFDFTDVDIVVLAGDIISARCSHDFLKAIADVAAQVIHVCGNHEFYGGDMDEVWDQLRKTSQETSNYHFLEKDTVTITGQRFVGCTLFYDGGPMCQVYEAGMNDFYQIRKKGGYRNFIYPYAEESKQWLSETVQQDDVVVTHMLPSERCIDNSYTMNEMNGFYFNNCDLILEDKQPKLWLHGHSHNHYDQQINKTRVVRNPFGYPGQRGVNFRENLRIDTKNWKE